MADALETFPLNPPACAILVPHAEGLLLLEASGAPDFLEQTEFTRIERTADNAGEKPKL